MRHPIQIKITGPGDTFCFESEVIKRALEAEGIYVTVQTNHDWRSRAGSKEQIDENMAEARRRMKGDWSGGTDDKSHDHLGKVERSVVIVEDHLPWGG